MLGADIILYQYDDAVLDYLFVLDWNRISIFVLTSFDTFRRIFVLASFDISRRSRGRRR